jgi:hypothetical protein
MDPFTYDSYPTARLKFIEDYKRMRGGKAKLQEDISNIDPLAIFLMEKQYNQAFNKSLLAEKHVVDGIMSKWPALRATGRPGIPFFMGKTPIIGSIKVAEGLLNKGKEEMEVGMILLYEKSEFKRGISKNNREWSRVSVLLSDGYTTIECTDWKGKAALGWPKNSVVYVRGELKAGWKTPACINVVELVPVE